MEEIEKNEATERDDIFSTSVRAGKRTYYFDVKSTRKGDYYLTITERKRHYRDDGSFEVEKHKIFLYREDFEKFMEILNESVHYINENAPEIHYNREESPEHQSFSEVDFEDLDR